MVQKKQPLLENMLRNMMKRMAAATALPGKKTNHSVHKTVYEFAACRRGSNQHHPAIWT